jgi:hypothetical protein
VLIPVLEIPMGSITRDEHENEDDGKRPLMVRPALKRGMEDDSSPSFKQGGIIAQTTGNLLQEGYPRLEFGVVDGGSTISLEIF